MAARRFPPRIDILYEARIDILYGWATAAHPSAGGQAPPHGDLPMAGQSELLQGTLDLLILKALMLQPLHGLGVARRIEQLTGGTFQVKPGSLFPALHRLEEKGWLSSEWGVSETNRRAKY